MNWSSAGVSPSMKTQEYLGSFLMWTMKVHENSTKEELHQIRSEKQLLLPVNLGRIIRHFPNKMESIILQRERLFTSGKAATNELPMFPWVEVRGQSTIASKTGFSMFWEVAKTQEMHEISIRKRLAHLEWILEKKKKGFSINKNSIWTKQCNRHHNRNIQ